jgi:hypothetical protein
VRLPLFLFRLPWVWARYCPRHSILVS